MSWKELGKEHFEEISREKRMETKKENRSVHWLDASERSKDCTKGCYSEKRRESSKENW